MSISDLLPVAFVLSLVLAVPLSFVFVGWFKKKVEARINTSNNFTSIETDTVFVQNTKDVPKIKSIAEFPVTTIKPSLRNEWPMLLSICISGLIINYLSFPWGSSINADKFIVYLVLCIFPVAYYLYFLFEYKKARTKYLISLIVATTGAIVFYVSIRTSEVIATVLGLLYFYGASSLIIFIGILFPRIREIVYAVLPPLCLALLGFAFITDTLANDIGLLKRFSEFVSAYLNLFDLSHLSNEFLFFLLFLFVLTIFFVLAYVLRIAYIKKYVNNVTFQFDILWLFHIALVLSMGQHQYTLLWILFVFALYKIIFYLACTVKRKKQVLHSMRSLLVLRVFSLNKQSASIFQKIRSYWRYQGPIYLIAGYDLTATTIDIDDLLVFLAGRLKNRFNLSLSLIKKNFQSLDAAPDVNGHYRVNELYCNNSTWKTVLDKLVRQVDFVLMDVRTFSEKNAGCAHEIRELIYQVPLGKICFIVDHRTNLDFFHECIRSAWIKLPQDSPNILSANEDVIQVYEYTTDKMLSQFLN